MVKSSKYIILIKIKKIELLNVLMINNLTWEQYAYRSVQSIANVFMERGHYAPPPFNNMILQYRQMCLSL